MKIPNLKSLRTKTARALVAIGFVTIAGFYACSKSSTTTTAPAVTLADAQEFTKDAVISTGGGLALQAVSAASIYAASSPTIACDTTIYTTLTGSNTAGATFTYNYNLSCNYELICSVSQFTMNFAGRTNFTGPVMTSKDSTTYSLVFASTQPTDTAYSFSCKYIRGGSEISAVSTPHKNFITSMTITSSNIAVSKAAQEIVSGSANIVLSCENASAEVFDFTGTITFLGNNKATLYLNGTTSTITWD